jgi:hypothetical protein
VRVDLIAAPQLHKPMEPFFKGGWPPGRLVDRSDSPPEVLETWAARSLAKAEVIASGTVAWPDGAEATLPVALKPPGEPAPAAPPAAEGAAATPPAEEKPPAVVNVTQGLICRIADTSDEEPPLIKWIEIVPYRPSSYFEFKPNPAFAGRDIQFMGRPIDADGDGQVDLEELPPGLLEQAAPFAIRGDDEVFDVRGLAPVNATGSKPWVELRVQPLADVRGIRTVAMDADKVPRAFFWDADFERRTVVRSAP